MKQANEGRLGDLIVLRLSVRAATPPAPSDVSKALYALLARQLSASEWREAFRAALAALRRAGLVDDQRLALTDAGWRRAQALLRLKEPPKARDWRELKRRYLPRLLFGADVPEGKPINPVAAVLAQQLGLPIDPGLTLEQVARRAVAKFADAPKVTADAVTNALALRWLCEAVPQAAVPQVAVPPAPALQQASSAPRAATASTLEHVVEKVRRASAGSGVRRYGPEKVFIASVWEVLSGDAEIAALGEQGFKDVLAEAHRRGLVTLSRADLVAAMDPRDVAASEIRHQNATYHFIQRGASA
jgi:hypothetical protein